jgi:hypothetical protein
MRLKQSVIDRSEKDNQMNVKRYKRLITETIQKLLLNPDEEFHAFCEAAFEMADDFYKGRPAPLPPHDAVLIRITSDNSRLPPLVLTAVPADRQLILGLEEEQGWNDGRETERLGYAAFFWNRRGAAPSSVPH